MMYSVYLNEAEDDNCIYDDRISSPDDKMIEPELYLKDNESGSLTFTLPYGHKMIEVIELFKSLIIVKKFDKEIWRGRVIGIEKDFWKNTKYICEGILSFLNDTVQLPYRYKRLNIAFFIQALLNKHNDQVNDARKIYKGNITVPDILEGDSTQDRVDFTKIDNYTNFETTLSCFSEKLVNCFGGHLIVKNETRNSLKKKNYLDYVTDTDLTLINQTIEFGTNLLDYTDSSEMTDFATVIVPLGKNMGRYASLMDFYVLGAANLLNGSKYLSNGTVFRLKRSDISDGKGSMLMSYEGGTAVDEWTSYSSPRGIFQLENTNSIDETIRYGSYTKNGRFITFNVSTVKNILIGKKYSSNGTTFILKSADVTGSGGTVDLYYESGTAISDWPSSDSQNGIITLENQPYGPETISYTNWSQISGGNYISFTVEKADNVVINQRYFVNGAQFQLTEDHTTDGNGWLKFLYKEGIPFDNWLNTVKRHGNLSLYLCSTGQKSIPYSAWVKAADDTYIDFTVSSAVDLRIGTKYFTNGTTFVLSKIDISTVTGYGTLRFMYDSGSPLSDWTSSISQSGTLNFDINQSSQEIVYYSGWTKDLDEDLSAIDEYVNLKGSAWDGKTVSGITCNGYCVSYYHDESDPDNIINKFGRITKVVHFDDIEYQPSLWFHASRYLKKTQFEKLCINITAFDLSLLNREIDDINFLDKIKVSSYVHGLVDEEFIVTELRIPLDDPQNMLITLGKKKTKSLSEILKSNK